MKRYSKVQYAEHTTRRLRVSARLEFVMGTYHGFLTGWDLEVRYGSKGRYLSLEGGRR